MVCMDEPLDHVMRFHRWQASGACARSPNDSVFFVTPGRPRNNRKSNPYCVECPVKRLCLEDALVHGDQWGVWGGLDKHQRKIFARTHESYMLSIIRDAIERKWLQESRMVYADKRTRGLVSAVRAQIALEKKAQEQEAIVSIPQQSTLNFETFPQFSVHTEAS